VKKRFQKKWIAASSEAGEATAPGHGGAARSPAQKQVVRSYSGGLEGKTQKHRDHSQGEKGKEQYLCLDGKHRGN